MNKLFIFILAVALLCILGNQINNLAYVLTAGSPDYSAVFGMDLRMIAGITWAVGIELGVLISVLKGAKKQAAVLAVLSCLVNVIANQMANYPYSMAVAKLIVYSMSGYLLWYFSELGKTYFEKKPVTLSKQPVYIETETSLVSQMPDEQVVYTPEKTVNTFGTVSVNTGKPQLKKAGKQDVNRENETWQCDHCDYLYTGSNVRQNRYNHLSRKHPELVTKEIS
ncbi:hypothetical protein QNI19_16545 [Cytophagaceae bacterium DM2B3-1]|uniref:C2H2-type domain-containing protein n=1 Tax=Xanthocytophaga flava TaxID=3048013 RepID=A0ABT7CLX9_9BACT|nr:hypothetical protein [Xanthocytophaga flavus]MDJ1494556.1 hypothetical protein [Xanthocytophaga flavus]